MVEVLLVLVGCTQMLKSIHYIAAVIEMWVSSVIGMHRGKNYLPLAWREGKAFPKM